MTRSRILSSGGASAMPLREPVPLLPRPPSAAVTASLAKPMSQLRAEAGPQGPMPLHGAAPAAPGAGGAWNRSPQSGAPAAQAPLLPPPVAAQKPLPPPPAAVKPPGLAFDPAANRPLLGNPTFRNLATPRTPGASPSASSPMADKGPMMPGRPQQTGATAPGNGTRSSHDGFASYLDEQTAGSPRSTRGRRPGMRFTEGPMRGKTLDQASLKLREQYAGMSPEQKQQYEARSRNEDISTEVPGNGQEDVTLPPGAKGPIEETPQRTSVGDNELYPMKKPIRPLSMFNAPARPPLADAARQPLDPDLFKRPARVPLQAAQRR